MRALLGIPLVLLILLSVVPAASADSVVLTDVLDNGLPTVVPRFDCGSNTLWCHFQCDGGPVSTFCDWNGSHGPASCIILIRFTSTCVNPLPQ